MGITTKTLYDTDFVEWTARTAELQREGRFEDIDLENLAEEVEDLGKSERPDADAPDQAENPTRTRGIKVAKLRSGCTAGD